MIGMRTLTFSDDNISLVDADVADIAVEDNIYISSTIVFLLERESKCYLYNFYFNGADPSMSLQEDYKPYLDKGVLMNSDYIIMDHVNKYIISCFAGSKSSYGQASICNYTGVQLYSITTGYSNVTKAYGIDVATGAFYYF